MKRPLLVAALGVAALSGVSLALVFFLTVPPPPPAEPGPDVPAAAPDPPPVPAPPPRTVPRREPGTAHAVFRSSLADGSTVPMASRVTRKAVRKALLAAPIQPRLARCVDRDAGFGAAPGAAPRDRPATLLVELETGPHGARIVDVQVQRWGGASEDVVSCARRVLLGTVVPAPGAGPARRVRMPYPLNPRPGGAGGESLAGAARPWSADTLESDGEAP